MFKATEEKIKDILFIDDSPLKIPKYQRPYTWSKDQVDDFWNDLIDENIFFIGSFIFNSEYSNDSGTLDVIDGQQRLITITIFLSVLRDVAKSFGHNELALRIHKKTIISEDFSGNRRTRIETGETLKKFFSNFIQTENRGVGILPSTKEERLIFDNYDYFATKIGNDVKKIEKEKQEPYLQKLLEKISNINCIVIRITKDEDAYSIFETVNARGVDLSVADLLKNFLFKKLESEGKLDYGQEKWEKMVSNILDSGAELQKFLRYFWLSKYNFVTERDLYKTIKKTSLSPVILIDELFESSELYSKIYNNNLSDWEKFPDSSTIHKAVLATEIMGISQCHVLFLSVLRNIDGVGGNTKRIFESVEHFSFLYSAVSKLQANKVEKIYSKFSVELEKENKTGDPKKRQKNLQRVIDNFITELATLKPPKTLFVERFNEIEYKNSKKSRGLVSYILSNIDSKKTAEELTLNFDAINIEHIIPQNPASGWGVTKNDIKKYVNLLGNLVLISKKINSEAGNKSLEEKCKILNKTTIPSTKKIIEAIEESGYVWGEEQIKERQKNLAERAYEIWAY